MGFNFKKSFNLGKGFKINLSKSGIGYSWGTKGFRTTKSASGQVRNTFSIPGTGISYTHKMGKSKKGKLWTVVIIILVLGATALFSKLKDEDIFKKTPVSNELSPSEVFVYLTASGEKYHKESCKTLKDNKNRISLDEAIEEGYSPCKICNPPAK